MKKLIPNNRLLNKLTAIFICVALFASSCKKEIEYRWPKGTIEGKVILTKSDYVGDIEEDCSGVLIEVEGASPLAQATSDVNGDFKIDNLETGLYDIVFSKEGYGTVKMPSVQFVGGNIPFYLEKVDLYKIPDVGTVQISRLEFDIRIVIEKKAPELSGFQLYFSESPNVSFSDYKYTSHSYGYSVSEGTYKILLTELDINGFKDGTRIYVIAYPKANTVRWYMDTNTGNKIYIGVNTRQPSNVISFVKTQDYLN